LFQKRQVGGHTLGFGGSSAQHNRIDLLCPPGNLLQQAGFADAWVAYHQSHTQPTSETFIKQVNDAVKLALSAHQGWFRQRFSINHDSFSCSP
jgi:hypothetical protein